jgi:phosphoenolpyruvate-protein phosphotransferase
MDSFEYAFECPLPNGLHARPASLLAAEAARFAAEITLIHEPTGSSANAKSTLALIALDVKHGDGCRVRAAGADAASADAALREFLASVLPGCDEPLAVPAAGPEVALPRSLRAACERWYVGTAASPGIGEGVVVVASGLVLPAELAGEASGSHEQEEEKVRRALDAVRAALEAKLAVRPSPIEAAFLGAHLAIASDVALSDRMLEHVRAGCSAGQAIVQAVESFAARLKAAESLYVRERAVDIEDIGLQLLEEIYGERFRAAAPELTQPSIVVAEILAPRQLLALDRSFLRGLVLERGGTTSHAVILARSFGIPALTGVADARANLRSGQEAIVDADLGILIPEVGAPVQRHYERRQRARRRRQERLTRQVHAPAITRDGRRLEVAANVATAEELDPAFAQGADGIGLFRTEMLFMDRDAPPSEEEQFEIYAQAARTAAGRPVIIRTFDIGGDKPVPYLRLPREANPFLGYRGVRIYPQHPDVVAAQARAILRASAFGRVWLMVPMVSTVEEVRWVKARLADVRAGLEAAGIASDPAMPVGIMVEVPSAALSIDQLAAEVDFFSVGTNDLAQYVFAADRESHEVGSLHDVRHPAFLRLLARIAGDAHRHGRWVGLCGEMARDAVNLPLLLGLGLDEISTAAPEIPALKAAIAQSSVADCRVLLEHALACHTAPEVEDLLAAFRAPVATRSLLERELITLGSDSGTKEEAIEEIVDAFSATGRTKRPRELEEAVWAREAAYSTGLGHGFAIPHCKTDAVTASSIGVVRLERPIEWGSVDGRAVRCVILLAIRESDPDDTHMKVFAKLARKLVHEEFRERMLAAAHPEAVLQCLAEELGIPTDQVP